jgi:hypothetical protein
MSHGIVPCVANIYEAVWSKAGTPIAQSHQNEEFGSGY